MNIISQLSSLSGIRYVKLKTVGLLCVHCVLMIVQVLNEYVNVFLLVYVIEYACICNMYILTFYFMIWKYIILHFLRYIENHYPILFRQDALKSILYFLLIINTNVFDKIWTLNMRLTVFKFQIRVFSNTRFFITRSSQQTRWIAQFENDFCLEVVVYSGTFFFYFFLKTIVP